MPLPPRRDPAEYGHDMHDEAPYDFDQMSPVGDWAEETFEYPEDERSPATPLQDDGDGDRAEYMNMTEANDKNDDVEMNGTGSSGSNGPPLRHRGQGIGAGGWDPIEFTAEDLHDWEKKCRSVNPDVPHDEKLQAYRSILAAAATPHEPGEGDSSPNLLNRLNAIRLAFEIYYLFAKDEKVRQLLVYLEEDEEKIRIKAYSGLHHILHFCITSSPYGDNFYTVRGIIYAGLYKTLRTNVSSNPSEAEAIMSAVRYMLKKCPERFLPGLFEDASITNHGSLAWLADKYNEIITHVRNPLLGARVAHEIDAAMKAKIAEQLGVPESAMGVLNFAAKMMAFLDRFLNVTSAGSIAAIDFWTRMEINHQVEKDMSLRAPYVPGPVRQAVEASAPLKRKADEARLGGPGAGQGNKKQYIQRSGGYANRSGGAAGNGAGSGSGGGGGVGGGGGSGYQGKNFDPNYQAKLAASATAATAATASKGDSGVIAGATRED